jgi:hypothetical protein
MSTKPKRIALAGYHDPIFWPFAQRLEADGFEVYWINTEPISSDWLRSHGVSNERICDVLEGEYPILTEKECIDILRNYEQPELPTINSIIFMDQNLRHAAYGDSLNYLAVSAGKISAFLQDRNINLVSSGRDTALQLLSMLVCKKAGIFWGCVTRVKLPKEWFGFSPTHQGSEFCKMRPVEQTDLEFATAWLDQFRSDPLVKPLAKPKFSGFKKIFNHIGLILPLATRHLRHRMKIGPSRHIPGPGIVWQGKRYWYTLRNYIFYRYFLDFYRPVDEPFILYGLHRQPESSIDVRGAFFDDQLQLIKQVVRSIPVTHKMYVKVHFSDVIGQSPQFYRALKQFPSVKLIDPDVDSRGLIRKAAVIVTNVGAMGQEGGYWGRPVIAMSKMFWCDLPTVKYCGTPTELPQLIRRMIESPPADDREGVIRAIAGYIANNVPCDPCQKFLGIEFSGRDLAILSGLYEHVYSLCTERTTAL